MKLAFWKREQPHGSNGQARPRRESNGRHSRKIKILMVDDEVSFTRLTKRNLEAEGFEVHTENKARQALPAAKMFRPDIILLDVMMPDGDGGEVAAQIAQEPDLKDTPVLFLTAAIKSSEIGHGGVGNIGGRFYIAKPVEIDHLVSYIEEHAACST